VLVPLTLTLAGCGAGDPPEERSASGPDLCTHDAESLLPAMTDAYGAATTMRLDMAFSTDGQESRTRVAVVLDPDGSDLHVAQSGAGGDSETVLVGGRLFMRASAGEDMVEVPETNPAYARTVGLGRAAVDLERQFLGFEAGLERVVAVGEEEVGGEPTCHYTLTVDPASAAAAEGISAEGTPESIDYEVYVDEDDLVRRYEFTLDDSSGRMDATWNEPLEIEVPAGL